ncbi:MAG: hypothetical protein WAK75_08690 [Methanoregula sp.]|uniref:hypothetical protein n=1 Tax=Methanoregula sp. TaxID=2052170 RepID=UPI003BB02CE8
MQTVIDLYQFNIFLLESLLILSIILGMILWIYQKWKSFTPAQKIKTWSKYLSIFIFIEFFVVFISIIIAINEKLALFKPIYNSTSLLNLKDFIFSSAVLNGASISFENFSGLIGVISIVIIYLYFFYVFSNTKYFAERTAIQEKYAAIFWSPVAIVIGGGLLILYLDSITNKTVNGDVFLFVFGFITVMMSVEIPIILRQHFYNNGISFDTGAPDNKIFNYDFIDSFRRLPKSGSGSFIPDLFLALTLIMAFYSYISDCNIFMLILVEFCILTVFFWLRQLSLIPTRKMTIELKDLDSSGNHIPIKNVFIITDSSKGYFVVLHEDNSLTEIMKDSVHQLIYQND